jgi:hypothetical protein
MANPAGTDVGHLFNMRGVAGGMVNLVQHLGAYAVEHPDDDLAGGLLGSGI